MYIANTDNTWNTVNYPLARQLRVQTLEGSTETALASFAAGAVDKGVGAYPLIGAELRPGQTGIESYAQPDGYHIKPEGYAAWVDYLCSHTME